MKKDFDLNSFIGELEAGVFKNKIAHMLTDVALGQVVHGSRNRKGKVTIELTFQQVGENNQVIITSKTSHQTITKSGVKSETTSSDTPFFVGKGGVLSIDQPKEEYTGQFGLVSVNESDKI